MLVLTIVLGVIVVGSALLVVLVPRRTVRREGAMPSDDRARVLLGEHADPDRPPDR
jgi:hypothetical protein